MKQNFIYYTNIIRWMLNEIAVGLDCDLRFMVIVGEGNCVQPGATLVIISLARIQPWKIPQCVIDR